MDSTIHIAKQIAKGQVVWIEEEWFIDNELVDRYKDG